MQRKAYAKLNLTLDVTGQAGGYHLLDSLVTTVDLGDTVDIVPRTDGEVHVTMHGQGGIEEKANNAYIAARALCARFGTPGVDVTIEKRIPIARGLGGSSADTAAVIAGMGSLFSVNGEQIVKFSEGFGSDTRYLLRGGFARMRGRGEQLEFFRAPALSFVILVPAAGILTADCFAAYDRMPNASGARTQRAAERLRAGDVAGAGALFGNDLAPAACKLLPAAKEALEEARGLGGIGSGLTGSGSACFAAFFDRAAAQKAKNSYSGSCLAIVAESINY